MNKKSDRMYSKKPPCNCKYRFGIENGVWSMNSIKVLLSGLGYPSVEFVGYGL
jgi:hypothetical protein